MKNIILTIGRQKWYPYVALLAVVSTAMVSLVSGNYSTPQVIASTIGAVFGIICVILLAKKRNSGNIIGILANSGEFTGNWLTHNTGAALPQLFFATTHLYGFMGWKKSSENNKGTIHVRSFKPTDIVWMVPTLISASLINYCIVLYFFPSTATHIFWLNNVVFGLSIIAQLSMILRFDQSWYLWILVNVINSTLQALTNNYIIMIQFMFYLFNAIYGLMEWKNAPYEVKVKEV